MTLQNRLKAVGTALTQIPQAKVYHYTKPSNAKVPYIVWMEEGGDTFRADNRNGEVSATGTIDIYSKDEFDDLFYAPPTALDGIATVELNSVQYEEDTKLIHYEYRFWC